MHREFDPTTEPLAPRSNVGLYLLTTLVTALLLADLWPLLANWLYGLGLEAPTWASREIYGYRLALIAAIIGGARALFSSLEALLAGKIGADLAIAIACIAAILIGEPLVAAEVIVIGLVGECLEAITFERTQRELHKLAELFPKRTWVLRDGQEVRVLTTELQVGDTVVVKPGGKIPVDGVVIEGQSALDTSALTGESLPRDSAPGDSVLAGCINLHGALTIRAEKVALATQAGQVIELTATALKDKAPLERYADKLARFFLPIVLGLAVLAFVLNVALQLTWLRPEGALVTFGSAARMALYPTLAVLVVACPCPLVLATPAAVIAALGRLAGTGVLLKGGAAIERLASVNAFAFDKTGTLTEGKLALGDVIPLGDHSGDDVLAVAAAAEARSEHPLARVIVQAAQARNLATPNIADFQAHPGAGVSATVAGEKVVIGTRKLLLEEGVALTAEADAALARFDDQGQTALFVARNGQVLGLIGARDTLRPAAVGVLSDLRDMGMSPIVLLTGDRSAAATNIARDLPLSEVRAELMPAEKAEYLARGATSAIDPNAPAIRYAYMGDGVNDAPALARATVGIAIGGTGADIAAEAGDVVMMGDPLRPLPMLVRLARETVRIIRQNIIWFGFGVNLVGVLLTGFLWPFFAGSADWYDKAPLAGVLYHQLGSLAVLLNSMRLLAFERTSEGRLGQVKKGLNTLDRKLAGVSLDDTLHEAIHYWKPIGAGVVAVGILAWCLTSVTIVRSPEVGVVQRFGAVVADLEPGLHLRWPTPIETVTRINPTQVRSVEVGFRTLSEEKRELLAWAKSEQERLRTPLGRPGVSGRDLTWSAAHADDIIRLTDESIMITGDGDLVEVLATVRYTVDDPQAYLFRSTDPDSVIRSSAESVLRELAAGEVFLDLLTTHRQSFERKALQHLHGRLEQTFGQGLGVKIEGLTLHDLHPPQEVVGSYHAVAEAIQKRDRLVNEAEADATRTKRRSEENALRIVRQAEADSNTKLAEAQAAQEAFLAWYTARTTLPMSDQLQLTAERDARISAGEDPDAVAKDINNRQRRMLEARRLLTDFRLGLQATVQVLAGRDKILIDADNLPGKRHLLLADPEGQRLPPWMLRQQSTMPDRVP